ncbi:PAS domain S-box protein [Novosphingobium panipatense]|uniref:histidine kinase n=2 Tax=Novosphingobium panipatense TaxID=428991 RepID=A0ABY1QMJ9_9SPHN|nr:PAS domain S-box protein [Novosphingobium panipatense]SMP75605.1 PAS domain S-box-containing protein [Novosphingobium panipatense]
MAANDATHVDAEHGLKKRGALGAADRLSAIIESSDDVIIGKTLDGIITDWNAGAERVFGYAPEEIMGASILTLIPQDRRAEEDEIIARLKNGERISDFETLRQRKDGSLIHISLTVSPIRSADGMVINASQTARDITARKQTETLLAQQSERLQTLYRVASEISRDLDLDRIVQSVTDIGTELSGAKFGAFFYNVTNAAGESYQLYTLSGAAREAFNFGMPRNTAVFAPTFAGEGVIRSDDIRTDPRYGHSAPHYGMPPGHLPVVSYLAVPVTSVSGEVLGGLFFAHDEPGKFTADTENLVSAIAAQTAVAMDNARLHKAAQQEIEQRRRAEESKELLLHELKHRVKNTLATIQAVAMQTFRQAPRSELKAFDARLFALSEAHDLLTQRDWKMVDVTHIVQRAVAPFAAEADRRFEINGCEVQISSDRALQLAMVLHELATNAVKYGALSTPTGTVKIEWELPEQAGGPRLELRWTETGGPATSPPARKGFGSRMIARALRGEGNGAEFDFRPEGLYVCLRLSLT